MWILPKNHCLYSRYALDMAESKKVLSECLNRSPSSLMWRSKPTRLQGWLTRWKKVSWFRLLSGRILRPSIRKSFEEALICFAAATRASRSARPENGKEPMTNGICGRISKELSENANPRYASLKTSKDISAWDWKRFYPTWENLVTELRREYSARLKSALLTGENGFSSWGTPRVTTNGGHPSPQCTGKGSRLEDQVAIYGRRDPNKSNSNGRSRESFNWPTPNCPTGGAGKDGCSPQGMNGGTGHREMLKGVFKRGEKLNPDWVEQLMGLPVGWTQLSGAKPGDNRIDRLRLLGNGVVPQTAEKAFRVLLEKIQKPRDIQKTFEDYL